MEYKTLAGVGTARSEIGSGGAIRPFYWRPFSPRNEVLAMAARKIAEGLYDVSSKPGKPLRFGIAVGPLRRKSRWLIAIVSCLVGKLTSHLGAVSLFAPFDLPLPYGSPGLVELPVASRELSPPVDSV